MNSSAIMARLDDIANITLLGIKKVLNIDDLIHLTGMKRNYIYRLTSEQRIPHYKQGKNVYFNRQEVEDWMQSERVKTKEEINREATARVVLGRKY